MLECIYKSEYPIQFKDVTSLITLCGISKILTNLMSSRASQHLYNFIVKPIYENKGDIIEEANA
jgi:hypothetical protein